MGALDRQDDHLLTLPGLSDAEKASVCATVAKGRGVAHALSELGKYLDDLDVALRDDEAFARDYGMALALRDEAVEEAVHRKARKGNVPAAKFWLTNRRPDNWSETRTTRHVGVGGVSSDAQAIVGALRDLLVGPDTRDQAIAWIERDADVIDAELVDAGSDAPGEDSDTSEAG